MTISRPIRPVRLLAVGLALATAALTPTAAEASAPAPVSMPAPVSVPASAAAPALDSRADQPLVQTEVLSSDAALKIAQAAMREAAQQKQRVTVVIVDRSGATRLVVKGDGAGPQTEESARRKAFTAVSFGRATSELAKGLNGGGPSIADIPGTLFLGGGVPVASGGAPVAGIGVGGAPSSDIDEAIARAGLKAVAGQLR
ncbi:heme-binding protein [Nonomuraea sp. PA05]|uniref:GlcG/HbpS family heme-binding protein n=1 Tax=Nonomuraea sp. PA05 TaxID=2604466 RepID=UPI0011D43BD0|nr:heme-binding protein [Nonomuraea sp. PA05]TYB58391.1 heme-binding protein [Nonomuraea sp. PA05]